MSVGRMGESDTGHKDEIDDGRDWIPEEYQQEAREDGSGTCTDCGHKFNKFSSTDFTGKLCNKCFAKTGASYGTGIGT